MAWRKPANIQEWLGILVRHKKKFFFPAIITATVVIWSSQFMPRSYKSDAKFQRKSDTTLNATQDKTVMQTYSRIRSLMQYDFKGEPAIDQLIKDVDLLHKDLPMTDDSTLTEDGRIQYASLVTKLRQGISVRQEVGNSAIDLVSVSYTGEDPEICRDVVNTLIETYLKKVRTELDDSLIQQKKFFSQEVTRYRRMLSELETAKLRFMVNNDGISPEDPAVIHEKLTTLKRDRDKVKAEAEELKQKVESLVEWEKGQPEFKEQRKQIDNPELAEKKELLVNLKKALEYNQFELRRTDEHPAVKDLKKRIEKSKKELAEFEGADKDFEIEEVPNVQKIEAQRQINQDAAVFKAKVAEYERLEEEVQKYEVFNRRFFEVRNEYLKIERDTKEATGQLKFWDDNLRRTQVALTMAVSERGMRLSVVQQASKPTRPSSPTLSKILGMSLFLGLGIGALFVILAELLDTSYRTVEQAIDDIKIPVLGAVNEIVSPGLAMRRKVLGWGVFPACTAALALVFIAVFILTYLSLEAPHKYKALKDSPVQFIKRQLSGT